MPFNSYIVPVFLRFLFGGSTVVASTLVAKNFGGRLGGVFAAFPAVYLAAIMGLSMDYEGRELLLISRQLSSGALVGMTADVFCALAASFLILRCGWKKGLAYALSFWIIIAPVIYFLWFGF
jgi:Protein of unknown function (DUF3147)